MFIRGNMVPWTLRPHKLKQQLQRQPVTRKQSSKKTRNGAKRGTLLNHPIETPQAPPQQPTPQGSVRCSNGLGRNSFLENHPKSKRGRSQKNTFVATNVHLQEAASTTLLNDFPNVVPENLSSNEETTHEGPKLSQLMPPARSDQFRTGEAYLKVLQGASLVLISEIIEASDANRMIDLSSKTFAFLDSIGVDYLPLYNAVHSVICHQCDKEALDEQKQGPAFVTKTMHDQITSTFSNVKETKSRADTILEDAQHELAPLIANVGQIEEELKKAKEEKAKGEAKLAAALAEKVLCDNAYSKAEAELKKIADEMAKAQVVIDDVERRWNETMDGMNRTKDELLRLRI